MNLETFDRAIQQTAARSFDNLSANIDNQLSEVQRRHQARLDKLRQQQNQSTTSHHRTMTVLLLAVMAVWAIKIVSATNKLNTLPPEPATHQTLND